MNEDAEVVAAAPLAVRYETLARVSQAIGTHGSLRELLGVLADELHRAVQFDFIGVSLRDKNSGTFQNYFIDMTSRSELILENELPPEETLTFWVYERQEPLLRSTNEMEPSYSRLQAIFKKHSVRSTFYQPVQRRGRHVPSGHHRANNRARQRAKRH